MRFATKLSCGIGLALFAFALIGAMSYRGEIQYEEDRQWVNHTHLVLEGIAQLQIGLTDAGRAQRDFILSGKIADLDIYQRRRNHLSEEFQALRQLTADNSFQQHNLDELERLLKMRFGELERQIAIRRQMGLTGGANAGMPRVSSQVMGQIRDLGDNMTRHEESLLQKRLEKSYAASTRAKRAIVLGNVLAFVFLFLAGVVVQREMVARQHAQEEVTRLNQELNTRVYELTTANRELDAFSHSLAHDLRAPLRHMHSFAELLRESWHDKLDDDGRRFLGKILHSSREMGTLVDDLLNFSRLARIEVQSSDVNARELVERARIELEPETVDRAITWQIGELPGVRADPALLYQALFNLLANAVKYTRRCTSARIEVGSMAGGDGDGQVTLFVRDNGAGFDMQYADKLFRVFQRLHRASDFEGTGVGLANVRRIVERNGGRVWAEGVVGQGATFYVSLPAALAANSLDSSLASNPSLASSRRQDAEQARVYSAGR